LRFAGILDIGDWPVLSDFIANPANENPRLTPGAFCRKTMLLLLLAFAVGLLARLSGILRMLLSIAGMFFALCVVAFAVMFGCSAMRLGGILVMLGCLIVFVSSHWFLRLMVG